MNLAFFGGYPLDPCDELRGNDVALEKLLKSDNTRFIIYYTGTPLMDVSSGLEIFYLSSVQIEQISTVQNSIF